MSRALLLVALVASLGTPVGCGDGHPSRPVLFFLHNRFVELAGPEGVHEEYGRVEYAEILDRFREAGFDVRSEVRSSDTDVVVSARRVADQVREVLRGGMPPSRVTIVGTSKGGFIARQVTSLLAEPDLGVVLVGCCPPDETLGESAADVSGRILSIYEEGDVLGASCGALRARSHGRISRFEEVVLHTGLRHGYLYRALDAWMLPAIAWALGRAG